MNTCLPFSITPSITAMSSQNIQYVHMSSDILSLFSGQPLMICFLSCCRCSSYEVGCWSVHTVMQSGIFVVVFMASIFNCMSGISAFLCSLWFCLGSQSAMNRSGPGLYMILTLYWCFLSRIICSLCDSVPTSFWKITTSHL